MNGPPTREEIDAKLDNVRMSAEVFFARMDARCARMEASMAEQRVEIAATLAEFAVRFDAKIAALYKAMIITAVTSTLTITLGVGAINATVFTGMLAAFDKGDEMGAMYTKLGQRMVEQDARFNQMILKQREDFARLEASLEARLAEEKAERARRRNPRAPGR